MRELLWHGPIWGQSGYEVLTRGILVALDKIGIKVKIDEAKTWNRENISMPWEIKSRLERMCNNQISQNAPVIMHQKEQDIHILKGVKKYCYTLFETDHLPKQWIEGLLKMDGVFTFSNFNRDCWIANDNFPANKLHVLQWGVDDVFIDNQKQVEILNARGYKFLANGDFVERKNFEILLTAYIEEFNPNEDVTLILKTHYGGFTQVHKDALLKTLKNFVYKLSKTPPKILFFPDKIMQEDMAILYKSCDCLVMPSKGEGLGLPVLEAMAAGLPVIAADGSSLKELPFAGIRIPCKSEIIDSVSFIQKCPHALNHKWVNIGIDDLRNAMRQMFRVPGEGKNLGKANRELVLHGGRSWHNAAIKMIKVIYG